MNWLSANRIVSLKDLQPQVASVREEGVRLAGQLPRPRYVVAMAQGTPEPAQVYIRGSHRNLGEELPARFLEALGAVEGSRLQLASEVVDPENPLTARVFVNRVWHHLFGAGLVPTLDDFGPMGQPPTHPALLDWLARDCVDNGWSLKGTIRQIVLSQTYGQSSVAHPEMDPERIANVDPTNALLHRMPVRRLSAEAIRDALLSVSGRLDPALYGPSQPVHLTSYMSGRGRPKQSGPLDGNGRRTVYGEVRRNFLPPFLLTFDMPAPFGPKGRRSVSNVPAQSLALLNDPMVHEQAERLAQRALDQELSEPETLSWMVETTLGRPPTQQEIAQFSSFLASQNDPSQAWADVAHILFNTKAFIYLQ